MPSLGIIAFTDSIADYCFVKYQKVLSGDDSRMPFPTDWSLVFLQKCDWLAFIACEAYQNQSLLTFLPCSNLFITSLACTDWDADRYSDYLTAGQDSTNLVFEQAQSTRYPPMFTAQHPCKFRPAIIADIHRWALLWYLPRLLLATQMVRQTALLEKISIHAFPLEEDL